MILLHFFAFRQATGVQKVHVGHLLFSYSFVGFKGSYCEIVWP